MEVFLSEKYNSTTQLLSEWRYFYHKGTIIPWTVEVWMEVFLSERYNSTTDSCCLKEGIFIRKVQ